VTVSIALLGSGAAGSEIARDLVAAGADCHGTHRHARRRADEMTAAARQLLEFGIPPRTAGAARDLLIELRDRQDMES
jgi:3-hydroxyisobutyrate dehydrogenase-like beta-hydroxyacid dehydrogenase